MNCKERTAEPPIVEKVEWSLPNGLSDCALFIRGRPGTTFDIRQYKD
jgi:hypothetical protein